MAIHNFVSLFGIVRTAPQIKEGLYGRTAMVAVTVVRGDRREDTMLIRTSLKYSSPILFTQDENLIDEISTWQENDVVYSKGFLATKEIEKKSICPHCNTVNLRREACQAESVRSGGNMIYFSPIFAEKVRSFDNQEKAHVCVLDRAEISNIVFLLGNLTCEPIQWFVENKPYTRYQLAINRKYCPKGLQEVAERTDYPWIYSFGQQAIDDYKVLHTGSLVFVDGTLRTRKYKETYKCKECGEEYDVPGRTIDVLSHSTEYLRDCDVDEIE